jgi:hypothetical protein
VEAFKETLELGLTKPKQIVVRIYLSRRFLAVGSSNFLLATYGFQDDARVSCRWDARFMACRVKYVYPLRALFPARAVFRDRLHCSMASRISLFCPG